MLNFISWTQFLTTLFISAGFYYLAVLLLFYRKDLLALMTREPSHTDLGIEDPLPVTAPVLQPQPIVQGEPAPAPQEKPSVTVSDKELKNLLSG